MDSLWTVKTLMWQCFALKSFQKYFNVMLRCGMETRELTVLAGSFVGFQLLFTVVSPRLSSTITPGYTQLPHTKLTEWNSRCVTLINSIFFKELNREIVTLGLNVIWFFPWMPLDLKWGEIMWPHSSGLFIFQNTNRWPEQHGFLCHYKCLPFNLIWIMIA